MTFLRVHYLHEIPANRDLTLQRHISLTAVFPRWRQQCQRVKGARNVASKNSTNGKDWTCRWSVRNSQNRHAGDTKLAHSQCTVRQRVICLESKSRIVNFETIAQPSRS